MVDPFECPPVMKKCLCNLANSGKVDVPACHMQLTLCNSIYHLPLLLTEPDILLRLSGSVSLTKS